MASTSSTLPYFWQLASASTSARLLSSHNLVEALQASDRPASEQAPLSSLSRRNDAKRPIFDDGLQIVQAIEQPSADEIDAAESALTSWLDGEAAYAVRRLLRGLASHRASARLGFSVALAEILARQPTLAAQHALVLLLAYSHTSAKTRGQEERDLLFARLFGLATLIRSGVLTSETQARLQDWTRAIDALYALGRAKTWLRESAASVVVQAVEILARDRSADGAKKHLSWRTEAQSWLARRLCQEKHATPETIAIYLTLRRTAPGIFKPSQRLAHFASQDVLTLPNLPVLARVLRGAAEDDTNGVEEEEEEEEEEAAAAAEQVNGDRKEHQPAGSSSLRAHFVWGLLLQQLFSPASVETPSASLDDVFRIVMDESLFAPTASHQKKAWGFQVLEQALRLANEKQAKHVFTPNLLRTLINQLSSKDRVLNKAAQKVSSTLQDIVKERPALGPVIIGQLTSQHGTQRFDAATGSKTVEGILRCMRANDIQTHSGNLMKLACTEMSDGPRKVLFDQLLVLVRNAQIDTSDACCQSILTFFAVHGFFSIKSAPKKADGLSLQALSKVPLSSNARAACRSRFLSCLSDLHAASVGDSETSKAKARDVSTGQSWIVRASDVLKRLDEDTKHFESLSKAPSPAVEKATATATSLRKRALKEQSDMVSQRAKDYEALILASLMYLRSDHSAVSSERANEVLEPLVDCAERLLLNKKQQAGEPGLAELFVHCLATILEEPSVLLRSVATQAFNTFSDIMTREAMQQLIDLLGFNEKPEEENQTEESGSAIENDDNGMDDVTSDSMSDTSATSSASEGDEEETVDEKFADEVRNALKAGGIADRDDALSFSLQGSEARSEDDDGDDDDDDDNDDEGSIASELDDEQMMLVDDKLADIFRQRFSSRKEEDLAKKETVAFHIKIVDLLDSFAKRHGSSPLCTDMVLPLLTIALEKDAAMDQLRSRAANVLQKTLAKGKQWPSGVPDSDIVPALEAIHKVVTTGLAGGQSQLASAANIYLTRAASSSGDVADSGVKDVYASTLDDFVRRKASNLKPQFVIDALSRFPALGFALRHELLTATSGPQESAQHSFRQLQVLEMLRVVLTQLVAGFGSAGHAAGGGASLDVSRSTNPSLGTDALVDMLVQLRILTLTRAREDNLRLKEVLKAALHFVRLTRKLADKMHTDDMNESQRVVARTWPMPEIEAAIEALGSTNPLPNSASLQSLLRQMAAIVGPKQKQHKGSASASTGNDKKRTAAPAPAGTKRTKKQPSTL